MDHLVAVVAEIVTQAPLAILKILCVTIVTSQDILKRLVTKRKKDMTVHIVKPNNSDTLQTVKIVKSAPHLQQIISLDGHQTIFEIDTGAGDSFLSKSCWIKIGRPALQTTDKVYISFWS